MTIFGYGRVSTREQSAENQRLEIERAGYAIGPDFWYADEGVSGKLAAMKRPRFAEMFGMMRKGETLVVSKLDRLGRDAQDVGETIAKLADKKIEVIVLQLGKLDMTSTTGKLMMRLLAAIAEMERDLLIERTQAGLARAKAEGKKLGRPSATTAGQKTEIIAKHHQGESISSLARQYKLSRAGIHLVIKESAQP